jgi:hypothetical protein
MRKNIIIVAFFLFGTILSSNLMAEVDVSINVNIPLVQFEEEPVMAVIPGTYIYFIYGRNDDFFFFGGYWWRFHHNRWYRATHYNGPWKFRKNKYVPATFFKLSPDWRKMVVTHSNLKYQDVKKNWKQWEKEKHWEKKQDKKEIKKDLKEEKQDKKEDKGKKDKDNRKSGKGRK